MVPPSEPYSNLFSKTVGGWSRRGLNQFGYPHTLPHGVDTLTCREPSHLQGSRRGLAAWRHPRLHIVSAPAARVGLRAASWPCSPSSLTRNTGSATEGLNSDLKN